MQRRFACIALPEVRVEIVAERGPDAAAPSDGSSRGMTPLAIVIARPGGAVATERDVLGGTRIDVASAEARRLGVHAGQTVAAARAKCAALRVRVVSEDAVRAALVRVAEAALAFGPAVAFDIARDVVWVEIGGCAHLHGGEPALVRAIERSVHALGHACRIAVADGPRLAAAVARHAPSTAGRTIVPPGRGADAVRSLPIAALALDDDVVQWLHDLGLHACGDLQKLPRRSFGTRLGARAQDVLALLEGHDESSLDAWRPEPVPEERVELEWGAATFDALVFVVKALCDRIAARVQGRGMSVSRVELVFELDRALCAGAPPRLVVDVVVASAVTRASELLALLRTRMERETLAAPVRVVVLRAVALVPAEQRTLDLLAPEPKAARALPRLVSELAAEIDPANVGTLQLVDTWIPDERTRLVPFGAEHAASGRSPLVTTALEPSRLARPCTVPRSALRHVRWLVRVEGVEWWRRGFVRRDIVAAWLRDGDSAAATVWAELGSNRVASPRPRNGEAGRAAEAPALRSEPEEHATIRGWID